MYNPFSLLGKTILVTGASSGIGRATAIECSKMGAQLIVTGRDRLRLEETWGALQGEGHLRLVCDLSDESQIDSLVEQMPEIQGLVNNAGISKLTPVNFIKSVDLSDILRTNTVAPITLMQKLLKKKKLGKEASVVFTSSVAGIGYSSTGNGMYSASKGAISAFIKAAAIDLGPRHIRVNAVCPGMVNTHLIDDPMIQAQIQEDMRNYLLGRYGEPEEIAWSIIYLLSDASKWVTGTNMIIDGGLTTR